MKKHIAKTNTDQRCVVMFMQIPGREDHALICPIDHLTPRLEQAVMEILESPEGQASPVLANVMGRRLLGDTGESVMQALFPKYLQAVPIDNVIMMPFPNRPFPLRQIIESMGGMMPTNTQTVVSEDSAHTKFNPHANIPKNEIASGQHGTATGLLAEADLLEQEARVKRARAYALAPDLRPVLAAEESLTEETAPKKRRAAAKKVDASTIVGGDD